MKKKGSAFLGIPMWFIVIAVIIGGVWYFKDDDVINNKNSLGSDIGVPKTDLALSSLTSGLTSQEIGGSGSNNWKVLVTKSQLNSANNTALTFTLTASALDAFRADDGSIATHVVTYDFDVNTFKNQDDTTDVNDYRPIQFVDNNNRYNVTIDGTAYAEVNQVSESFKLGTNGVAVYSVNVEDYTTLDKAVANDYEEFTIAVSPVLVDNVQVGTVSLVYMETP